MKNLVEANKTIKKLHSDKVSLVFSDFRNPGHLEVLVCAAATDTSVPRCASSSRVWK